MLASGSRGDPEDFAAVAASQGFAKGEGLPGKAGAEERPVVLTSFEGS